MKKFFFLLSTTSLIIFGCSKSDLPIELSPEEALFENSEYGAALQNLNLIADFENSRIEEFIDKPYDKALMIPLIDLDNSIESLASLIIKDDEIINGNIFTLKNDSPEKKKINEFEGNIKLKDFSNNTLLDIYLAKGSIVNMEVIKTKNTFNNARCHDANDVGYCVGLKIESMGLFESASCYLSGMLGCVAVFAADCIYENCKNLNNDDEGPTPVGGN